MPPERVPYIDFEHDYFIEFFTKGAKRQTIDAVRVRLDMVSVEDMGQKMHIDLCDHPLYANLVKYVQANPPKATEA